MKKSLGSTTEATRLAVLEIAERLFGQIGFQKTTVADIARALHMSSANVYRSFSAKAEIDGAVAGHLLGEIEAEVVDIAKGGGAASEQLRAAIAAIERRNAQRFLQNRKLYELVEAAFNENWPAAHEHLDRLNATLAEIIARGVAAGEFHVQNCELAAILVRSACLRFCNPRLMVECAQDPEPTIDQMVDFCLAALRQDVSEARLGAQISIHPLNPLKCNGAAVN
jgi:AcrR family transcriptional regulator